MPTKQISENNLERIDMLLRNIDTFDPTANIEEEELLATVNSENDLHILAELAKTKTFKTRYFVIRHLGKFEYENVISDLIFFINDENKILASEAEQAIDRIKSERKFDFLMPLLKCKPLGPSCLYAIKALGKGERVNAVLPLLDIIDDEDPKIRYHVIDALRLIGDPRTEKQIIKHLDDNNEKVRYAATFFCGSRKIKSSADRLFKVLQDPNPRIRLICVWAIGELDDVSVIPRLEKHFESETDNNVRNEILRVLFRKGKLNLLSKGNQSSDEIGFESEGSLKCITNWFFTFILKEKKLEKIDICLFVEGSYPYLSGGVSSWVHDLLSYFSDIKFSLVNISTSRSDLKEFKYKIPKNVIYLNEIYLFDLPENRRKIFKNRKKIKKHLGLLLNLLSRIDSISEKELVTVLGELGIPGKLYLDINDILFSIEGWEFIKTLYEKSQEEIPFLDYYWSFRSLLIPIFNILNSSYQDAEMFYTVLTGYAGLASTVAKVHFNKPMMLTEHGIYHRERMFEIRKLGWIYEREEEGYVAHEMFGGLKKLWIEMYHSFSLIAYKFSSIITTLYRDNAKIQIEGGASPEKVSIIPNGMEPDKYFNVKDPRGSDNIFNISLVGRVVSIKDIKTFIQACKIVNGEAGEKVRFLVLGPYNEEIEYADECFALTKMLGLDGVIKYTGNVDLMEYLKHVDIMVLTSISEGQPLSLMEAMASGIPCVSTNVGACKELLYGKDEKDAKLGKCGIITSARSPAETARAILTIINDPSMYASMAKTGKERISRYYNRKEIFETYRNEFKKLLQKNN